MKRIVCGETPLIWTTRNGYERGVATLLANGARVDLQDDRHRTALMYAAIKGNVSILKLLLNVKLSTIGYIDANGRTALMLASKNGHIQCVQLLLKHNANVSMQDYGYQSAMDIAKCQGHSECAEVLSSSGKIPEKESLMVDKSVIASENKPISLREQPTNAAVNLPLSISETFVFGSKASSLTNKSQPANASTPSNPFTYVAPLVPDGRTPLTTVAERGELDNLLHLLRGGTAVNQRDSYGNTALMWAAGNNHVDCLRELIAAGADVNAKASDGFTALMWACNRGHLECIRLLLAAGAKVIEKSKKFQQPYPLSNQTALSLAINPIKVQYRPGVIVSSPDLKLEIVRLLIEHGADVNQNSTECKSPLYLAVMSENLSLVALLLDAGAYVNNPCSLNALSFANSSHLKEI